MFFFRTDPTEPVFVDLLRSPGIDSQPSGPIRQPYLLYWPAKLHGLAESISRNRFPSSLNVYKYGLSLHKLAEFIPWSRFLNSINI
jgi:hypothetical protein